MHIRLPIAVQSVNNFLISGMGDDARGARLGNRKSTPPSIATPTGSFVIGAGGH